jgi:hypothetical protein
MTGSPPGPAPSRNPGPDERTSNPFSPLEEPPTPELSAPPTLFVDQAPTSRPSGRYAVGLRPSHDRDAYLDVCWAVEDSPILRLPRS